MFLTFAFEVILIYQDNPLCLENICFIDDCKFEIYLKGHHAGEYAALLLQSAFENPTGYQEMTVLDAHFC